MRKLRNTIKINAPVEQVWAVLGDLSAAHTWIPGVTTCKVDGMRRVCNNGEIEEMISDYSPERRSYRYAHVRIPLPVEHSRGTFTVSPDAGGSLVVWDAELEALDPGQEDQLITMLDGVYKQVLESLRRRITA